MAGKTVKLFTDNQGVKQIISVGSKRSHLQDGAMAICFKHSIKLVVDWVPRSLNERADITIRIIDHDDWSIDGYIFQAINSSWPTVVFGRQVVR